VFKKILVPYDGSKPAEQALQQAVSIAKSLAGIKAEVIVLHVVAEFPNYHFIERPARSIRTGEKTTVTEYLKEVNELMQRQAGEVLSRKTEEIKKRDDFEIKTRIASGTIVKTILSVAENEDADLIIIGNVGRSGMSRLKTLGSVSRGVAEQASCPVMIIH
jgi:nucleotide-binding universal stress UspA family protein